MNFYGYIYKSENLHNGVAYIGQHRGDFDPGYLGSGVRMLNAIKKYGRRFFSLKLLDWATTKAELNDMEVAQIKAHRESGADLYNTYEGGYTGPGFWPWGAAHQSYGKKRTPEMRERMSQSAKKRGMAHLLTAAAIAKRSGAGNPWFKKGLPKATLLASVDQREGKPGPRSGTKMSPSQRAKMVANAWGKQPPLTPEARAKLSAAVKAAWARRKQSRSTVNSTTLTSP